MIVSVGALIVTEDYVTNNSIIRGSHSGWGIVTYLTGKTVEERVGAYDTTIWSMKVEIEAITVAVDRPGWTANTLLCHSNRLPKPKIGKEMFSGELAYFLTYSQIADPALICYPRHGGVHGMTRVTSWRERPSHRVCWIWTSWTSQRLLWTNCAGMKSCNKRITPTSTEGRNFGWSKARKL